VNCATIHDGVESRQSCATTLTAKPAVHLEKEVSVEAILPGQPFDWTLTLSAGEGLTDPIGASLTDVLPDGVTLTGPVECTAGECAVDDEGVVSWSGVLAPDSSVIVTLHTVLPPEGAEYPQELENCAQAGASSSVAVACVTTPVGPPSPPQEFSKSATPEAVPPGEPIHYTITVPYLGAGAQDVAARMRDLLPEYLQLSSEVSCSTGGCGYDDETREVYWLGLVAAGEVVTVEFDALLSPSTLELPVEIENCAAYSDANGTIDQACVTTPVVTDPGPTGLPPDSW
jgi:hypothetical protein